jgi:hypothetical protein
MKIYAELRGEDIASTDAELKTLINTFLKAIA